MLPKYYLKPFTENRKGSLNTLQSRQVRPAEGLQQVSVEAKDLICTAVSSHVISRDLSLAPQRLVLYSNLREALTFEASLNEIYHSKPQIGAKMYQAAFAYFCRQSPTPKPSYQQTYYTASFLYVSSHCTTCPGERGKKKKKHFLFS